MVVKIVNEKQRAFVSLVNRSSMIFLLSRKHDQIFIDACLERWGERNRYQ